MSRRNLSDLALALAGDGLEGLSRPSVRALAEAAAFPIVYVGPDGLPLYANPAARDVLTLAPVPEGEPAGCFCHRVLWRRSGSCEPCGLSPGGGACQARRRGDKVVHCAGVRDASGRVLGAVLVCDLAGSPSKRLRGREGSPGATGRLRDLLEHAGSGVFFADARGRYLMVNKAYAGLLGVSEAEAVGGALEDFPDPEIGRALAADLRRVVTERVCVANEFARGTGGARRRFLSSLFPLDDQGGSAPAVCGMLLDVVGRREREESLRKSQELFRMVSENIFDYYWVMDENLRFIHVSASVERVLGYAPEEFLALPLEQRYAPASLEYLRGMVAARVRDVSRGEGAGLPASHLLEQVHKDGRAVFTEAKATEIYDAQGAFRGLLGVTRDVTDRVRAEEKLRRGEEKYRGLFEDSAEGIFRFLPDGRMAECNPAMARILGYAFPRDLVDLQTDVMARLHVTNRDRMEFLRLLAKNGRVWDYETRVFRADGKKVWISINARAALNHAGELVHVDGAARDITARKRAEQERMLLVAAVEQTAEAVVIVGRDQTVEYANPAFSVLVGLEAADRENLRAAVAPFLEAAGLKASGRGRKWSGRVRHARPDGSEYVAEVLISPIRDALGRAGNHVLLVRDVTYETDLEKRLRRAEKLEAIGVLAGGIAHDFNNILTPILLNSEMVLADLPEGHELRKPLGDVLEASERARDLVKQILTFSRRGGRVTGPLTLGPLVKETLKLLDGSLEANVQVRADIAGEAVTVLADPAQMRQVVMNLCLNAAQAMRGQGGLLQVGLDTVDRAEKTLTYTDVLPLPPGKYARLTVRDQGSGMEPEVARRIFEPFFTTKRTGQGTGMGLAAAHGAVRACGGSISVKSRPGQGSVFTVLLPLFSSGAGSSEGAPAFWDPTPDVS